MKKIVVSDSSTLILLEKINLLSKLIRDSELIIPEEVYRESVIKGKIKKFSDAYAIEHKVNKKLIKIKKAKDSKIIKNIMAEFGIAEGEAGAIALFLQEKANILAIDDHKSINVCKIYKIPFATALTFVLDFYKRRAIKLKEAKNMIEKLGIYGRYKDEIIYKALNYLEGKK